MAELLFQDKKDQEYAIDKDNNTHYNVFKFQFLDHNKMQ